MLLNCHFRQSRLLINVDPFIDDRADSKRAACIDIASHYFGEVCPRLPDVPNFSLALKWLWEFSESEYIFNLEDDWELLQKIDLLVLLEKLGEHSWGHIMLRAWTWRNYDFCLAPGLLQKPLYKFCAGVLTPTANPEATIRSKLSRTKYKGLVFPENNEEVILRDLGRSWLRTAGYVRGGGDFVVWAKETLMNRSAHDALADQCLELRRSNGC
jgi:hypothetical protein